VSTLVQPLSEREQEVMALLALGHTNKQIAGSLFVSPETVKTHLVHVYRKLGVSTRAGAVSIWRSVPPVPPSELVVTAIRVRLPNGAETWFSCDAPQRATG
jgi:DNA-binding CsgD family transcriptional regulator